MAFAVGLIFGLKAITLPFLDLIIIMPKLNLRYIKVSDTASASAAAVSMPTITYFYLFSPTYRGLSFQHSTLQKTVKVKRDLNQIIHRCLSFQNSKIMITVDYITTKAQCVSLLVKCKLP